MSNPTREQWEQLAKAALAAAIRSMRAAASGQLPLPQLHSVADYAEAVLDQAPQITAQQR